MNNVNKILFAALAVCCLLTAACKTTKPSGAAAAAPPAKAAEGKATPAEVQTLREQALAAREEALKMKADKAVKDEYAHAVGIFGQGETASSSKRWQEARTMYVQAADEFTVTAKIAREKRELAELAYRDANTAILETRRKALETESELRAAGIEVETE